MVGPFILFLLCIYISVCMCGPLHEKIAHTHIYRLRRTYIRATCWRVGAYSFARIWHPCEAYLRSLHSVALAQKHVCMKFTNDMPSFHDARIMSYANDESSVRISNVLEIWIKNCAFMVPCTQRRYVHTSVLTNVHTYVRT